MDLPNTWDSLVSQHFLFPDSLRGHKTVEYLPFSTTKRLFNPPSETIHLHMKKDLKLTELHQVVFEINEFVKPLEPVMPLLIFFCLNRSSLFDQFLKKEMSCVREKMEMKGPDQQISQLCIVLDKGRFFLKNIMEGTIKYGDMYEYTATDLVQIRVEEEFNLFCTCPELKDFSTEGLEAMKSMLKLLKSLYYINKLNQVCKQYKLAGCLSDPELHKLTEIARSLESAENKMQLTPSRAHNIWKSVCHILCLNEELDLDVLTIFETVSDSVDFFHFLVEMNFSEKGGESLFRQQHEFVTAELEHDVFTDTVLNHLFGAFFFIVPFMDQKQNLRALMNKIVDRQLRDGQQQLLTVKSHMQLIRLWFSRVQVRKRMLLLSIEVVF